MQINFKSRVKILLGLIFITFSSSAYAHNAVKLIHPTEGETIFMLSDNPLVSLEGRELTIKTQKETVMKDFIDGTRFQFIDYDPASISFLINDETAFSFNGKILEAYNLCPLAEVRITDISGRTYISDHTDETGFISLSLDLLPEGIYIFTSKDKNFKFYKK